MVCKNRFCCGAHEAEMKVKWSCLHHNFFAVENYSQFDENEAIKLFAPHETNWIFLSKNFKLQRNSDDSLNLTNLRISYFLPIVMPQWLWKIFTFDFCKNPVFIPSNIPNCECVLSIEARMLIDVIFVEVGERWNPIKSIYLQELIITLFCIATRRIIKICVCSKRYAIITVIQYLWKWNIGSTNLSSFNSYRCALSTGFDLFKLIVTVFVWFLFNVSRRNNKLEWLSFSIESALNSISFIFLVFGACFLMHCVFCVVCMVTL